MAALLVVLLPTSAMGAVRPGTEDLAFGSCGVASVAMPDTGGQPRPSDGQAVAVQPDGKILVAAEPDRWGDAAGQVLTRLLPDGRVDLSFGFRGSAGRHADGRALYVRAVVRQADGRIVVGGSREDTVFPGRTHYHLVRFLADGVLDDSFGGTGEVTLDLEGQLLAMALQPDGRILVGGGGRGLTMARLTTTGALDSTFGANGVVTAPEDGVKALAVQNDGRIVVGFDSQDGHSVGLGLRRLLPDGAVDPGFGSGGRALVKVGLNDYLTGVVVDGAGRIATVGWTATVERGGPAIGLARYLPSGALDPSFGDGGKVLTYAPAPMQARGVGVRVQEDGKLVVALDVGQTPGPGWFGLARYTSDGSLDGSFGRTGGFTFATVSSSWAQATGLERTPEGDWIVVGSAGTQAVVRYKGEASAARDNGAVTSQNCRRTAQVNPVWGINFGRQVVGGRGTVRTVTVRSTGTGPLRITAVTFSKENEQQYTLVSDGCSGATLAPGTSCTLALAFTPTTPGSGHTTAIVVWDNAPWSSQTLLFQGVPTAGAGPRAWGWNGVGQLGDGTTADTNIPWPVAGPTGVVSVASGAFHDVALRNDGTVWSSGLNNVGELGDNTTVDRHVPVPVPGFSGVMAVAAGAYHTLALKGDGTVWAWGWNYYGQLGDGTTVNRVAPVRVVGLSGVVAIAAGAYHNYALLRDGTVRAWGLNHVGQLGDGTTVERHFPMPVSGLRAVTSIAGGAFHGVAVATDGTVRSWGWNYFGQLGDGTTYDRHVPVTVSGVSHATSVAAGGYYHTLVLTRDNDVLAWGLNNVGQLGDGTTVDRHAPVRVPSPEPIVAIAGGGFHSLAVVRDGTVRAWGWNHFGQLGDNTYDDAHAPVRAGGLSGVAAVSAGAYHSQAN